MSRETFQSQPKVIPLRWRELAMRLSDSEPLGTLARATYRVAASRTARNLNKIADVCGVALRGGALSRPVPGVSDIDLSVYLSEDPSCEKFEKILNEIRLVVLKARKTYPMLGEVLVLTPSDIRLVEKAPTAQCFSLYPQRALCGEIPDLGPATRVSAKSRFMQAFEYFERILFESSCAFHGPEKLFHKRLVCRLAAKLVRLAPHQENPAMPESLLGSLALAFQSLDLLARLALTEGNPVGEITEIRPVQNFRSSQFSREAQERLFLWWARGCHELNEAGKLEPTSQANRFVWNGSMSSASLERLFDFYLNRSSLSDSVILITPHMNECFSKAISNQLLHEMVGEMNPHLSNPLAKTFRENLYQTIHDRFIRHMVLLPYHLTTSSEEVLFGQINSLCLSGIILRSRIFEWNFPQVLEVAKPYLPRTAVLLENLHKDNFSRFDGSAMQEILEARRELASVVL